MIFFKKEKSNIVLLKPSNEEFFCVMASMLVYLVLVLFFSGKNNLSLLVPNLWLFISSIYFFKKYNNFLIKIKTSQHNLVLFFIYIASVIAMLLFMLLYKKGIGIFSGQDYVGYLFILFAFPVIEEIFFRGIVLNIFWRVFESPVIASVVVTAIFALLHPAYSVYQILLVSLFLCWVAIFTRNLLWSVVFHMIWNALTIVYLMPSLIYKFYIFLPLLLVTVFIIFYLNMINEVKL